MNSDYKYEIIDGVICITDLNKGGMSVTNNIEKILMEIYEQLAPKNGSHPMVIARDSDETWDEVRTNFHNFGYFAFIGVKDRNLAIAVVKDRCQYWEKNK